MAGPDFNEQHPKEQEDASVIAHNTRIGLILFAVYLAFYGGYMVLSAFWPEVMSWDVLAGVNLAVTYGFALIGIALILALIYLNLCLKQK
jgi:uncharacterized membrane protein (DUF485 family)